MSSGLYEQSDHLVLVEADGIVQGHGTVAITGVYQCAVREQEAYHLQVSLAGGNVQSCASVVVRTAVYCTLERLKKSLDIENIK